MGGPNGADPSAAVRVTYLGHASLALEAQGETILTDPVYSNRIAHVFTKRTAPCNFRPEEIRGLVGVLISHGHHDHLDYPSLKRVGRAQPIVVPWGLTAPMRARGFTGVRVARLWEQLSLGRWQITVVPSRHFGGRLPFVFTSGYQGYVASGPGCVYFAGDTGFDEGMFREIGRRFAIDLAVLPISGAVFPSYRRNHMNAREALRAFQILGAKRMLPMHFDTFPVSFEHRGVARQQLLEEAARTGLEGAVTILPHGGSLSLNAEPSVGAGRVSSRSTASDPAAA